MLPQQRSVLGNLMLYQIQNKNLLIGREKVDASAVLQRDRGKAIL